jgi:hypothetical protein
MVFNILSREIELCGSDELTMVVNRCLEAETARLGIPAHLLETSLQTNEPEGGIDARLHAPDGIRSIWLTAGESAWQYKSGRIQPHEIENEFFKPAVQEVVERGGTYCLVVGDDYTTRRTQNARKKMKQCFARIGRKPRYVLLTATQIAQWASEDPVLLRHFDHPIGNLIGLEEWSLDSLHQTRFYPDSDRQDAILAIRQWAESLDSPIVRRVEGSAGVGKTRLVLESMRESPLAALTYYAPDRAGFDPWLFGWLKALPEARMVVVIDECGPEQASSLRAQAERCKGRVRVLTIHRTDRVALVSSTPEPVHCLSPLPAEEMEQLVDTTFAELPPEARRWVAQWSGGYPSLGRALATALGTQPELAGAGTLARQSGVHRVLQALLPGADDQKAMKVVALLTRVGWEGDLAAEGEAVAKFIGIPWEAAQDIIAQNVREHLVQKQGRYRYVTPHMLAVWLASEVWEARGDSTLRLLTELPTPGSRRALIERLADFGDNEQASRVAARLLAEDGLFPDFESIDNPVRAEIHGMLSLANSGAGLRALERILSALPVEELRSFNGGRRHVVWTLEKLAWHRDTFFGAARLLLALAEAENESIANNATGTWRQLFQMYLGGTQVPAVQRHILIREALESESVERRSLAIQAIVSALGTYETRGGEAEHQRGRVVPAEYRPKTQEEAREARMSALELLDMALNDSEAVVKKGARDALLQSTRGLVGMSLADQVLRRLKSLQVEGYEQRRDVRGTVQDTLKYEGTHLSQDQRDQFEEFLQELEGGTYRDRLRRWVGKWTNADWLRADDDDPERPYREITRLADEAFDSTDLLHEELGWLASAEAENVWFFGYRLGERDTDHIWLGDLVERARKGFALVLLASYLRGRADSGESEWREDLLDDWAEHEPDLAQAVYEATWRGEPSDRGADRLARLVGLGRIEPMELGILAWGEWILSLSATAAKRTIQALAQDRSDHAAEEALGMVRRRVDHFPGERAGLSDLAWDLLSRPEALASRRDLVVYHWSEVAGIYLEDDPLRLAGLIVTAICDHGAIISPPDRRLNALAAATRAAPGRVWNLVASAILAGAPGAYRLEMTLRGWYAGVLDTNVLLDWARDNAPKGPGLVAALAPIGDRDRGELSRSLLIHFGSDDAVKSLLARNYLTGSFSGPASGWLQGKLDQAQSWTQDQDENVRRWAAELVSYLQKDIEDTRLGEEELDL